MVPEPEPFARTIVFPLLHVATGVALTYFTIANVVNRTTIVVGAEVLRIVHAPLPWLGAGVIPINDVDQLYCRRDESRGESRSVSYSVHIVRKSGRSRKLVSGLDEPEEALFLEHKIERALDLPDYRVAGEYRG